MATPQSPLTPQMQDALQRGDMRALMHAVRASGANVDLPAARRALQQQLRTHVQQQVAARLPEQADVREALDAGGSTATSMAHVMRERKRQPTVEMGDRPGESRWVLIVAVLLALAVWMAFGGLDALPGGP